MSHPIPKFSRAAVDRVGQKLVLEANQSEVSATDAVDEIWEIFSNWRSAHAFPLNTITMDLRQKVNRIHKSALVVQRLKRTKSILGKLALKSSMRLTQMQDIGGCRAVVATIDDVYALRNQYRKSRSLHEFVTEDDYIAHPKASGYRGVHLVYRFQSRSRPQYNKLLFEIQLRTVTQHAWATAVETVGAVIGQALKSSEGEIAWLSYFQHAAIALEYTEQPSLSTPPFLSRGTVARTLADLHRRLEVQKKLTAYRAALKAAEQPSAKGAGYFLLVLLPEQPGLRVFAFDKRNAADAHEEYEKFERRLPLRSRQLSLFPELADYSGAQVVLVGAESFKSIRDAFPNYYLDTQSFLEKINHFIKKYSRAA